MYIKTSIRNLEKSVEMLSRQNIQKTEQHVVHGPLIRLAETHELGSPFPEQLGKGNSEYWIVLARQAWHSGIRMKAQCPHTEIAVWMKALVRRHNDNTSSRSKHSGWDNVSVCSQFSSVGRNSSQIPIPNWRDEMLKINTFKQGRTVLIHRKS